MEQMRKRNKSGIEEAVRKGYLKTDSEFMKKDVDGGSCCVTALIREGNLIVSNVGDCRAVLSRGGTAEALTSDHKASTESERKRIEKLVSVFCLKKWISHMIRLLNYQLLLTRICDINSAGWVRRLLSWCLEDTRFPGCVKKHRG